MSEEAVSLAVNAPSNLATPSLSLAQDTGSSASDDVTNISTINVSGLATGSSWQYQIDGGNWINGSGTSFSATEGLHSYKVHQSVSGMNSADSVSKSINLDTHPTDAGTITGLVPANEYANYSDVNPLQMHVALTADAAVGDVITFTMYNTPLSTGTPTPFAAQVWTVTAQDLANHFVSFYVPGSQLQSDAVPTFTAQVTDLAGNVGNFGYSSDAAPFITYVAVSGETTPSFQNLPNAPIPTDDPLFIKKLQFSTQIQTNEFNASDPTAVYDGLDNATIDHTLELNVTSNPGANIHVYDNGKEIGSFTANTADSTGLSNSTWTTGVLSDGSHDFSMKTENSGVFSNESPLFTVIVEKNLALDLDKAIANTSGDLTFNGLNSIAERYTITANQVLATGKVLTIDADATDTLVIDPLNSFGFAGEEIAGKVTHDVTNHYWQFDLNHDGVADLLVKDTIHRIVI
jgi:hypothetical protein